MSTLLKVLKNSFCLSVFFMSLAHGVFLGFQKEWVRHIATDGLSAQINTTDRVPMAVDTAGNIIISRRSWAGASKNDVFTVKYNTNGDTLWTRIWKYIPVGSPDTLGEQAEDIVLDEAGNSYILALSNVPEGPLSTLDVVILKYDPDGNLVDSVRWDETGDTDELMNFIARDPNSGAIYLSGCLKRYSINVFTRWCVVKFDSNLDLVWVHDFAAPLGAKANAILIDATGIPYVTGYTSENDSTGYNWLTIKYNPNNGSISDSAQYHMPTGGQLDRALAITSDPSGNIIVTGHANVVWNNPGVMQDFYTIKYDPNLNVIWERQYDFITMLADGGGSVLCDSTGNVYVTGVVQLNEVDKDIFVIKYNSSGDLQWTCRYGGVGFYEDAPVGALLSPTQSELYVCGHSSETRVRGPNEWQRDYLFLIIDCASGDTLQTLKYDGAMHFQDEAKSIALDKDGNVFVTGHTRETDSLWTTITTIKYSPVVDITPPESPYITKVDKNGNDVILTWTTVTADTLGNNEAMSHYVMYRSTTPDFVPGNSDSIGIAIHPDTTYIDVGALGVSQSHYYLVKAVDIGDNKSKKSNMGFKFYKFFNENTGPTSDRNWVSLPWHNNYTTVSNLTADLSPAGVPLNTITNLRDDQNYESYIYNQAWGGTNFPITSGKSYEMSAVNDSNLFLLGANKPDGLIPLYKAPAHTSDRNWVSIPYNARYQNASDITDEFSPSGNPLIVITNLQDNQLYQSRLWDPDFSVWTGNFALERGRGYEFVTEADTSWNPTEYTNREFLARIYKQEDTNENCIVGHSDTPDRVPVWISSDNGYILGPPTAQLTAHTFRIPGISHIVRTHLKAKGLDHITFIAYRPSKPYDVLTEHMTGCGVALKNGHAAIWFNVGNFYTPWQPGEEVILIVEAIGLGMEYYYAVSFALDPSQPVQELGRFEFQSLPIPIFRDGLLIWEKTACKQIIGYSLYKNGERLNSTPITSTTYEFPYPDNTITLKPIFEGGHETILGTEENSIGSHQPTFFFNVMPNPFAGKTIITYTLPSASHVEITVYDIGGRQVNKLISGKRQAGTHTIYWSGTDAIGRKIASGIYFMEITTEQNHAQHKLVMVR